MSQLVSEKNQNILEIVTFCLNGFFLRGFHFCHLSILSLHLLAHELVKNLNTANIFTFFTLIFVKFLNNVA
jgi:hypothetical protein